MPNRLYRSTRDKVIGGVCGGLGDYFDVDPTLLRLITVIATFATGGAVAIGYILAWIIVPQQYPGEETAAVEPSQEPERRRSTKWRTYLPGIILVGLGAILLLREYVYWFSFHDLWPILLVLVGLVLILRRGPARPEASSNAGYDPGAEPKGPSSDGGDRS